MSEIFVSPGVYVRERDFSYYVSSVNESSLALVGETKKGPAFLPTKITNISEFKEIFGNLDPNKIMGYAAKSYFKYANQAYVVRVLGGDSLRGSNNILSIIDSGGTTVLATFLVNGTPTVNIAGGSGYTGGSSTFYINIGGVYSGNVNLYDATSPVYVENLDAFKRTNTVSATKAALQHVFPLESAKYYVGSGTSCIVTASTVAGGPLAVTGYQAASTPMIVGNTVDATNAGTDLFTVTTISHGQEANKDVKITIEDIDTGNTTFSLGVRQFSDTNESQIYLEKFTQLSMDPTNTNYIARAIGDSRDNTGDYAQVSKYIYVTVAANAPATALPYGFNRIPSPISGGTSFAQFPMDKTYITTSSLKKQFLGLNFDAIDADHIMGGWSSSWNINATSNHYLTGFHLNTSSNSSLYQVPTVDYIPSGKTYMKFLVPLLGGNDGWIQSAQTRYTLSGTPSTSLVTQYTTAFNTISSTEDYDINLLAVPGVAFDNTIGQNAITFAEERADTFYIGDFPSNYTTSAGASNVPSNASIDSNYAATYWPYVKIYDSDNMQDVMIPPTPQVLEAIAYTDQVAYPWFAPAGMNRGLLTDVIKTQYKLTKEDRDELYTNKVNPIATLPGQGYAVWGQKTLQTRDTALNRINVRRMMLYIEKVIAGASRYLVFEQNDSATWDRFKNMVQPVLDRVKIKQGLYDFRVKMDETTNTPDMIDRGQMVGQIYIKPTKSAEAILINFNIMPTGAVFEE